MSKCVQILESFICLAVFGSSWIRSALSIIALTELGELLHPLHHSFFWRVRKIQNCPVLILQSSRCFLKPDFFAEQRTRNHFESIDQVTFKQRDWTFYQLAALNKFG